MNISALSRGYLVPTVSFDGYVHSVFDSALNVRLRDGMIVSILTPAHPHQPRAVRMNSGLDIRFDRYNVFAGDRVACRAGIIRLLHRGFSVDLRPAELWKCTLPPLQANLKMEPVNRAWRLSLAIALNHLASFHGIADAALAVLEIGVFQSPSPLKLQVFHAVTALTHATKDTNVGPAVAAASQLIGLGPGLTPAGDDFVSGFITGMWSTAKDDNFVSRFIQPFISRLRHHFVRTTDLSAAFLTDSVNQAPSEATINLVGAITEGQPASVVERVTRAALNIGSTSGADMVAGILLGLATPPAIHA